MEKILDVIVLAGGDSPEREVSLSSGQNTADALTRRGHRAEIIDPAGPSVSAVLSAVAARSRTEGHETGREKCPQVILPMLHGAGGEDGQLQEQLEASGLAWFGSSAAASRLTFNKLATRSVLENAGLPVPPGVALSRHSSPRLVAEAARVVGYPLVVKPAQQGSSVGITIVNHPEQLEPAVQESLRWGSRYLIEQYIEGREITVPVVNGIAFPPVEIIPSAGWYDYQSKYHDDQTKYVTAPPDVPSGLSTEVVAACNICGVSAVSRTDLRLDHRGRWWILEINTIPGMTSHSLVPKSAASMGISTGELFEQLLLQKLGIIDFPDWERSVSRMATAA